MSSTGIKILQGHLAELTKLEGRMEPDHVGRPNLEARIKEVEQAIKDERAAQKGRGR